MGICLLLTQQAVEIIKSAAREITERKTASFERRGLSLYLVRHNQSRQSIFKACGEVDFLRKRREAMGLYLDARRHFQERGSRGSSNRTV